MIFLILWYRQGIQLRVKLLKTYCNIDISLQPVEVRQFFFCAIGVLLVGLQLLAQLMCSIH